MAKIESTLENYIGSGNTNPDPDKTYKIKTRNVIITVNKASFEHLIEIIKYLNHFKSNNYLLCCSHDKPDIHYHIYAQYTEALKLDSRYLYGAHVEKCFGSAQQNVNYLKGLDDKHKALGVKSQIFYELGKMREKGGRRIMDILKASDDELLEMDINMFNTIMKVRGPAKTKVGEWHKNVEIIYIWGPSESGKSTLAHQMLIDKGYEEFTEIKHEGNFWLGVGGFETTGACIYDDFRDSQLSASEFINFIDYNTHLLNYKGGCAKNKFDLIIITTVQNPEEIYKNMKSDEPKKQWLRRMKIIHLGAETTNDEHTQNLLQNHDDLYDESKWGLVQPMDE